MLTVALNAKYDWPNPVVLYSGKANIVKTPFLFFLLACAATLALAADTDSLNGKWDVQTSISGYDGAQACTFTQKNDMLTGQCVGDTGTVDISGTIHGGTVTWSYKSTYDGQPLTVQFAGVLDSSNTIKGTVNVPEFGASGGFTAKQTKK